ncbi:MAG: hypothetical protein KGQ41_08755 [Alphaproteobacteria bacterium]|nr:hypothetical protein [Alphaproteobacteria bacterium]
MIGRITAAASAIALAYTLIPGPQAELWGATSREVDCKIAREDIFYGKPTIPQLANGDAKFNCGSAGTLRFTFNRGTSTEVRILDTDPAKVVKLDEIELVKHFRGGAEYRLTIEGNLITAFKTIKEAPIPMMPLVTAKAVWTKKGTEGGYAFRIIESECAKYEIMNLDRGPREQIIKPYEVHYEASCNVEKRVAEVAGQRKSIAAAAETKRKQDHLAAKKMADDAVIAERNRIAAIAAKEAKDRQIADAAKQPKPVVADARPRTVFEDVTYAPVSSVMKRPNVAAVVEEVAERPVQRRRIKSNWMGFTITYY